MHQKREAVIINRPSHGKPLFQQAHWLQKLVDRRELSSNASVITNILNKQEHKL